MVEPLTTILAHSRLASVQLTPIGFPSTSGLGPQQPMESEHQRGVDNEPKIKTVRRGGGVDFFVSFSVFDHGQRQQGDGIRKEQVRWGSEEHRRQQQKLYSEELVVIDGVGSFYTHPTRRQLERARSIRASWARGEQPAGVRGAQAEMPGWLQSCIN